MKLKFEHLCVIKFYVYVLIYVIVARCKPKLKL